MNYPSVDPNSVTPNELATALDAIRSSMSARQRGLLEKHYHSVNTSIPVDDRGQYSPIVSLYGKIGGALSRQLQRRPKNYHLRWIAFQEESEFDETQWVWRMRSNLYDALTILGWFGTSRSQSSAPISPSQHSDQFDRDLDRAIQSSMLDSSDARRERLAAAARIPEMVTVVVNRFLRNPDVIAEVLFIATGSCQRCKSPAPFRRKCDDSPYLEVHHTIPLSQGGDDTVSNAVALCPNCHRELHHGLPDRSEAIQA